MFCETDLTIVFFWRVRSRAARSAIKLNSPTLKLFCAATTFVLQSQLTLYIFFFLHVIITTPRIPLLVGPLATKFLLHHGYVLACSVWHQNWRFKLLVRQPMRTKRSVFVGRGGARRPDFPLSMPKAVRISWTDS